MRLLFVARGARDEEEEEEEEEEEKEEEEKEEEEEDAAALSAAMSSASLRAYSRRRDEWSAQLRHSSCRQKHVTNEINKLLSGRWRLTSACCVWRCRGD